MVTGIFLAACTALIVGIILAARIITVERERYARRVSTEMAIEAMKNRVTEEYKSDAKFRREMDILDRSHRREMAKLRKPRKKRKPVGLRTR